MIDVGLVLRAQWKIMRVLANRMRNLDCVTISLCLPAFMFEGDPVLSVRNMAIKVLLVIVLNDVNPPV